MEINVKEIFDRIDLQHIRSFIFNGVEPIEVNNATYDERLQESNKLILKRLHNLYKNDDDELSEARGELYYALAANSGVMLEIGMKIGARLLFQLLMQEEQT